MRQLVFMFGSPCESRHLLSPPLPLRLFSVPHLHVLAGSGRIEPPCCLTLVYSAPVYLIWLRPRACSMGG